MPTTEYIPCERVVQTLYSTHHSWLNRWLRSRLGNAADAADMAQDTFVRLLQKTERLELKASCDGCCKASAQHVHKGCTQ